MNKYEFNTDTLINEEEVNFPEKNRVRAERRSNDWKKAKHKKEIADINGVELNGGLHRFVDGNLSESHRKGNNRKVAAKMKKYYNSLNEERVNEASEIPFEDYTYDDPTYTEYDENMELLY